MTKKQKTSQSQLDQLFGAQYFTPKEKIQLASPEGDLYTYQVFFGAHSLTVERGDSAFVLSEDLKSAFVKRGPAQVKSHHFAVSIRGYAPEEKSTSLQFGTYLPYVNGCSTRQVFPPERPGDPTLQMLKIPPFASEQAHHIHSTARIVYILSGSGQSVVGMSEKTVRTELKPGMLCILDKMCPHHFETQEEWLTVLPVHVWSSTGPIENMHPMFNGTFLLNQGNGL